MPCRVADGWLFATETRTEYGWEDMRELGLVRVYLSKGSLFYEAPEGLQVIPLEGVALTHPEARVIELSVGVDQPGETVSRPRAR